MKQRMIVSCQLFYVTLLVILCKMSLQSPLGIKPYTSHGNVFQDSPWPANDNENQQLVNEADSSISHRRVKRFQGGVVSNDPFVSIIYTNNGTRIYPHDPITFHGTKNIHLTREQLIWERIYQILRRRGSTNVPSVLPDQTRNLLLQCLQATRSQTSNRLSDMCSNLSQGSRVPPGAVGSQHTHPGFEPYFPSNTFGSGNGFPHAQPSQAPSFAPGFTHGSGGHHHGPQGDTRPNIPFPNRFVNPDPYRPHITSHQSNSGGHLHNSQGTDGPPIFFG